jgi:hypothetical protein
MTQKQEILSKLDIINNSFNNKKNNLENVDTSFLSDLKSTDVINAKNLDSFSSKKLKKKQNNKDIFSELLEIVNKFISKNDNIKTTEIDEKNSKIKKYAKESILIVVNDLPNIVIDEVKKVFFSGENICGADSTFKIPQLRLKPSEIDFLNMLTIDPTSTMGAILYEDNEVKIPYNKKLYDTFSGNSFQFNGNSGQKLFDINWDADTQEYIVSNINTTYKVGEFFNDYYSSIQFPDFLSVIKKSMLLTNSIESTAPIQFKKSVNDLNKATNRFFAVCGSPTPQNRVVEPFNENEENLEDYFDFDNTDDVDFDEEDAVLRNVLKFTDCNNFEIPINDLIIEDFIYEITTKSIDDLIDDTLNKTANDAFEKSEGSVSSDSINNSLNTKFIKNLPRGVILSIMTPKIFFPITLTYKLFKSLTTTVIETKELLKKLSKLFANLIQIVFWKFIREFWSRIKKELINFIKKIVAQIIKNKYKRYVNILTSIIQVLKNIQFQNIDNCENLFGTIIKTIEKALSVKGRFNVPGFFLSNMNVLPGLSRERIIMDTLTRLQSKGVPIQDVYTQKNNIVNIVESITDALLENIDKYSYTEASNQPMVLASPSGPVPIPPGVLKIVGKIY